MRYHANDTTMSGVVAEYGCMFGTNMQHHSTSTTQWTWTCNRMIITRSPPIGRCWAVRCFG